jgi:hypothetical protein
LLTYAAGVQALGAGQIDQGRNLLERLPDEAIKVGRVTLRSPDKVLEELQAEDFAAAESTEHNDEVFT